MKHHFECDPIVPHQKKWVFDWDDETGQVTGPDAEEVIAISRWGGVGAHPRPAAHDFSAEPLKSKVDMAAIIGDWHVVPEELRAFYPTFEEADGEWDVEPVY